MRATCFNSPFGTERNINWIQMSLALLRRPFHGRDSTTATHSPNRMGNSFASRIFRAFRIVMYFPQLLAARDRHGRGAGCGGRGGVLRAMGSQGGFFEFVSDQ